VDGHLRRQDFDLDSPLLSFGHIRLRRHDHDNECELDATGAI
jgi:hypothetical protein